MGDLVEYARVSVKGGIELSIGMIISAILSALGMIIVTRLLSPEEYGLYTIAMVPATMIGLFRDWGVNLAVTRYVSFYRAESQEEMIKAILRAGFGFSVLSGSLFALITVAISDLIANFIFRKPEVAPLIKISAIWVFSMALFNVGWSTLIGFEKMKLNGIVLILRSTVRSILSPLLVLAYGAIGAVLGYSLAGFFAAILCTLLSFGIYRRIEGNPQFSAKEALLLLLSYGFPLAVSGIVNGFGNQFYRFLMSRSCTSEAIGNYGAASNFLVAIMLITSPIATVLLPAFSKIDGEREVDKLKTAFRASVKYSSFFVIPLTMGVMTLSKPLVFSLFGEKYSQAPAFLSLVSIGQLFCGIGALSSNALLASQGKTGDIMKANLISLAIGVPMSLLLIPRLGIYGLIATTLLVSFITIFVLDYMIYKIYGFSVDLNSSGRILLSSLLMAICVKLVVGLTPPISWPIKLVIGGLTGFLAYFPLVLVLKGINLEDLENLIMIFSKAGFVGGIIVKLLRWMELIERRIS